MKEQLYTIPVNEAFALDCECPVCAMHHKLKEDALDFTLGPSYMEDDIRMVARVLMSKNASDRIKQKTIDLKELIREEKEKAGLK